MAEGGSLPSPVTVLVGNLGGPPTGAVRIAMRGGRFWSATYSAAPAVVTGQIGSYLIAPTTAAAAMPAGRHTNRVKIMVDGQEATFDIHLTIAPSLGLTGLRLVRRAFKVTALIAVLAIVVIAVVLLLGHGRRGELPPPTRTQQAEGSGHSVALSVPGPDLLDFPSGNPDPSDKSVVGQPACRFSPLSAATSVSKLICVSTALGKSGFLSYTDEYTGRLASPDGSLPQGYGRIVCMYERVTSCDYYDGVRWLHASVGQSAAPRSAAAYELLEQMARTVGGYPLRSSSALR
jgi:hypothetical protein